MSFATGLKCLQCGTIYPSKEFRYTCGKCGGFLDVQYDYTTIADSVDLKTIERRPPLILSKWLEFLPIEKPDLIDRVTLGESETPLLKFDRLNVKLGLKNLYVKDDTRFPTCSLKDRSMPLVVLKAIEFGYDTVAIVSSGNAAASLSAYAARAGLKAVVFLGGKPPIGQIAKITAYGSTLIWIKGSYDEAESLFIKAREKFGWFDCNGLINPFRCEGKKTYAYEMASQLGWKVPDVVIMPVAFGNGLVATWKGFKELYQMGFIDSLPRLIGVQAEACAPIAKAFSEGKEDITPVIPKETIAGSIAVGNPSFGGKRVLKVIKESKGIVTAASEEAIIDAIKALGRNAGLFVEPAGAVSIAGVKELIDNGEVDRNEVIVSVITGHGLNSPNIPLDIYELPEPIEPKLEEIKRVLSTK